MLFFFFFNDTATTEIYTLSLHDALPIWRFPRVMVRPDFTRAGVVKRAEHARRTRIARDGIRDEVRGTDAVAAEEVVQARQDRKSTRLNSSHATISYAVFCLKKKTKTLYI